MSHVYTFHTFVGNKGNDESALVLYHRTMDKGK